MKPRPPTVPATAARDKPGRGTRTRRLAAAGRFRLPRQGTSADCRAEHPAAPNLHLLAATAGGALHGGTGLHLRTVRFNTLGIDGNPATAPSSAPGRFLPPLQPHGYRRQIIKRRRYLTTLQPELRLIRSRAAYSSLSLTWPDGLRLCLIYSIASFSPDFASQISTIHWRPQAPSETSPPLHKQPVRIHPQGLRV